MKEVMKTNNSSRSQAIWNTLRLSGLLALLGAWTALADPSFSWDTMRPEQNAETKEVALTQTATFSASDFGSGNGVALNQINLASVASYFGLDASVDYSLVSVVVSVTLVSETGPEWTFLNTSHADGVDVTITSWDQSYSLPVTLSQGESSGLTTTASGSTSASSLNIPAGDLENGAFFLEQGVPKTYNSTLIASAGTSSIADNEGSIGLDAFLSDGSGTGGVSVNAGQLTATGNTQGPPGVTVSVDPNLSLRVTITYNLVPEPTSFALLMTGAAFLLRRRRRLVK